MDSRPSSWRDNPEWPDVDVVMPIRNEAEHLRAAVASVRSQRYPGRLSIYLGIGPSEDDTMPIAAALTDADLTVVDNPSGTIPAALNLAIGAGTGPVVVRVDGHSELPQDYVRRAVETLRRTGAANVGGRQVPAPTSKFEQLVADVTTSWLGTGGARYRVGGEEGNVDTVFLGAYCRARLEAAGGYDESLLVNEDYELNIRLRAKGDVVWFDPELEVRYRPRSEPRTLARQYYRYGFWKAEVVRRHPESLRLRQLVPPIAVVAATAGLVLGVRHRIALLGPAGYFTALLVGARGQGDAAAVAGLMHVSWAVGLVRGLLGIARTAR